jgi:hypothetical protein
MPKSPQEKAYIDMSQAEREASAGRDAIEPVYWEEALLPFGKAAKAIGTGVSKARNAIDMVLRPKVKNEIVTPTGKASMLSGRIPSDPSEVTHAYRNISSRELDDIRKSKFARKDPTPDQAQRTWNADSKWWSAGDEQGAFGRKWKAYDQNSTIRTAKDKVPTDRAVRKKDLEVLDRETGKYTPLKKGGKVSAPKASRGDGCAQRGKTKGRFV